MKGERDGILEGSSLQLGDLIMDIEEHLHFSSYQKGVSQSLCLAGTHVN